MTTGTKAFIIVLAAIIFLFMIGDRLHLRSDAKDVRAFVMELDTAAIIEIRSTSEADPENNFIYLRNGKKWVELTSDSVMDRNGSAYLLLTTFQQLKVKRTMGSLLEFGDRFQLRPKTMRTITFVDFDGNEKALNIGSDTFGASDDKTWTYVHVPGGTEVYAVEVALREILNDKTSAH